MFSAIGLYSRLLGKYLRPQWPTVLVLATLVLSGIALQIIGPQFIRHFIDSARDQEDLRSLYVAAAFFIGVSVGRQVINGLATYIGKSVSWTATNRLRTELVQHVLRLDMGFHNSHTPGELVERIDGDVERLTNFFSQFAIRLLGGMVLLAALVAVTWTVDWRFGLLMVVYAVYYLTVNVRIFPLSVPAWQRESEARAELFGFLGERVEGIPDIQASGAVEHTMRRFHQVLGRRFRTVMRAYRVSSIVFAFTNSVGTLRLAGGLALGAYLFQTGEISIGTVYLVFHYLQMLSDPLSAIAREMDDLQKAKVGIGRVTDLLNTSPRVLDGTATLDQGRPSVEFRNVTFAYGETEPVVEDLSFVLASGRSMGLLGRTGGGKSTIGRLLFRFYDPDAGSVRFDDTDVKSVPLEQLRRRVGMVTQEVQLFDASVRDNLTLFAPAIDDEALVNTLRRLGLETWFDSLSDGLDTPLSSGGGQLSAGQAQLLSFARVFLKDPDVVLLDEASSRLDRLSESLIQRAIDELLSGRTAVVIAHRLSTVQRLDDIMIIDEGAIQELGPRRQLADDPDSRFRELLETGLEEVLT